MAIPNISQITPGVAQGSMLSYQPTPGEKSVRESPEWKRIIDLIDKQNFLNDEATATRELDNAEETVLRMFSGSDRDHLLLKIGIKWLKGEVPDRAPKILGKMQDEKEKSLLNWNIWKYSLY